MSSLICALVAISCSSPPAHLDLAIPNDNRVAAGTLSGDTLVIALETRRASWHPDPDVDSLVTVFAFAERGMEPRIPGPLIRVRSGQPVRISVHHRAGDSALVVYGLRGGAATDDTIHIPLDTTRTIEFTAGAPGTYLYTAATLGDRGPELTGHRDGLLAGAFIVDAAGVPAHTNERIFVMNMIDLFPDSATGITEDIWEVTVNGMSWPHTERFTYNVGDTVRWRWINATPRGHPMHLHGFHYRVTQRGNGFTSREVGDDEVNEVVTEFVLPRGSFTLEWVPTREGNWLMHCHMTAHITPFPERSDSLRQHDQHDLSKHPLQGMAGLVIGVNVVSRGGVAHDADSVDTAADDTPAQSARVEVREAASTEQQPVRRAFVVTTSAEGSRISRDSVPAPGNTLFLERGVGTAITVVNRSSEPTSVHWHGMELESIYDGVAGWSGARGSLAPMLAPGDSFRVVIRAPRSGTFIYHTHMEESQQLQSGLAAPMIVLDPGVRFDADRDRIIMVHQRLRAGRGEGALAINADTVPRPQQFSVGRTYRLRLINILPVVPVDVTLGRDSIAELWKPVAKDGAALGPRAQRAGPARVVIGVGETYDFEWTPSAAGTYRLQMTTPEKQTVTQEFVVTARTAQGVLRHSRERGAFQEIHFRLSAITLAGDSKHRVLPPSIEYQFRLRHSGGK